MSLSAACAVTGLPSREGTAQPSQTWSASEPFASTNSHAHSQLAATSAQRSVWRRYALNIGFNLLNKTIFKYFPYPYTVSTIHVVVGLVYCVLVYAMGLKSWSFGRVSAVLRCSIRAVLGGKAAASRAAPP
jgi:hypothetical protein